jgi:beta-N-acetylhexosaminidase
MTAHILYTALDAQEVATCSSSVIRLIRKELGFDGLLMSDDLSMGALSGHPGARAKRALVAGCDVALHCNGKPGEMEAIAKQTPALQGHALARFERALALLDMPPEPFDLLQAARELQRLRNAHQC